MSKSNLRRPQKKSTLKKRQDWDTSIGDLSQHRLSDDEASRRKQAYQSRNLQLIQDEKQRKLLAKAVHDARKNNSNQLGILREILFNERDVDELMQRSNHLMHSRSDKALPVPKNSILRSGKNHFTSLHDNHTKKPTSSSSKPSATRNLNSPGGADWNQSEEDNLSVSSADIGEDDELENEPVRLSRPNKKNDHHNNEQLNDHEHQQNCLSARTNARNPNLYSQVRQQSAGTRSVNNVSFMSDVSKPGGKTAVTESTGNLSTNQLKQLLDRLSSDLHDLETITGFKADKNDASLNVQSNTCSTALVTALIALTGHVKQCAIGSRNQPSQETNTLKDQLSVVIKAQLDFQHKIENQISMLQTMMQTVCQLVNNELISNKKCAGNCNPQQQQQSTINSARLRRDSADFQVAEPRQNWLSNHNNAPQRPKTNATDELMTFTQRMSSTTPTEMNQYRYSTYNEANDVSKKISRPTSAVSTTESNMNDFSKQIPQRRNMESESRSSMISPIDMPSSYDLFESGLPKSNSTTSMMRSATTSYYGGISNTNAPTTSNNETILEKILQERLLLVQQIAELNKQHEMTQEELASLEANALQQRIT
ncbi:unnamed protein product [Rotaria socialis]|uniref:Spindle and centriole-associated protein 1 n=1 Tax=Rotaria socialis TaxID=392032 RepID=A0A818KFC6_9BILA|nr:unnamed protein product [Rotaria socialis]CAF4520694.1 unnamed protein product [Rotaria socialis]